MLPFINIGSFELPMYGLMAIIGMAFAILSACYLSPKCGMPVMDVGFSSVYAIIGVIVGSKLLFFITKLPILLTHLDLFFKEPFATLMYSFAGFVFYGGLIGGALGIVIYCKQFHIELSPILNIAAPSIPLMHAFGRIGCFLGGCCYGKEYHGILAVKFPYNEDFEQLSAVERFPVQLVEASIEFILFIILFILVKKSNRLKNGLALGIYLIIYPISRFILEFFRGDALRGFWGPLSTSQWISLFLLPLGIYLIIKKENNQKGNPEK